ncbi:tetratricopeptide repeat-containing diguanylate cyclase [Thermotoga sp. KOL6]|uniref:tetratricopeptide repeat-containing diguanylate cyclase n=1 Tax=Thermotoga sp. KOL6 TaxID=126741 RepID=UPI000C78D5B6|nr:tetratricopeptide repeat-containing diguanylate cyclase [Thermotoga sp. KOL6]PLV60300.1 diguanylate cyclase [Thermotoga sp. KOL6]
MKVKKLLRETYWGDEFLVEEDGEEKILKIVNASVDRSFLFNEYAKLKRLGIPNVLIPEKLKISEGKYLFFYPYYDLRPVETLSENLAKQLVALFSFLAKAGIIVPSLGMDDLLLGDRLFFVPAFVDDLSRKPDKIVFFKEKDPEITQRVLFRFLKIHGLEYVALKDEIFDFEANVFKFPYLHREEEERIKEDIKSSPHFPLLILVFGEQRVGKTKMVTVLSDKLREDGYLVHHITTLEDLKMWYGVSNEIDLISQLDDGQRKILILDDFSEGSDLFLFVKELSLIKTKTDIAVLATSTKEYDFFHIKYRLSPFSLEKTRVLLEKAVGNITDDQVKLLYNLSRGLPGYIAEIVRALYKTDVKKCSMLEVFEPILRECDSSEIRELSVLGQKFSGLEVQVLGKITGRDYLRALAKAQNKGVVLVEDGLYRFSLKEFWKYYYEKIGKNERILLHRKLIENLPEHLIIKHVFAIEDKVTRSLQILRYVRKHFWDYEKTRSMIEHLKKLEEFLEKPYYFIESLKTKLLLRIDYRSLEKEEFHFSRFKELKKKMVTGSENLLKKKEFSFADLYKLIVVFHQYTRLGKKVPEELIESVEKLLREKIFSTKERLYLKARLLCEMFHITEKRENLKEAMRIASEEGFVDVQILGYRALGIVSRTRAMSNYYFNLSLDLSRKLDPNLAIVDESNLVWSLLYEGKISEFLTQLQLLRKQSELFENASILSYTYFLEGLYHLHRKDYKNAEKIFKKELEIEEKHRIERRALRGLVINYLFSENFKTAESLLKKDEPEFNRFGFNFLRDMVLAKDDAEFLNVWNKRKENPHKFFNEEIAYIFAERLAGLDPEGFEEFIQELERENIENSSNLMLALVYETMYKFYRSLNQNFKAKRFLRKAILIYDLMGMREVARKLGEMENSHPARDKSYFHAFLSSLEPNREFSEIMEFAAGKLSESIPFKNFSIKLIERSTNKVLEEFSTSFLETPIKSDFLEIAPFRTSMSFNLDMKHNMMMYVETDLECDEKVAWEMIEILEQFGNMLSIALRERLYRSRSIRDQLTNVLSRWYFMERFEEEVYKSNRYRIPVSLIMCDIDDFKKINDQFGHTIGDKVLNWVGKKLSSILRKSDLIGRYGGEEFIIALPGTPLDEAKVAAEKVRKLVKEDEGNLYHITMSFGVAEYLPPEDPSETIKRADMALYLAKQRGKDRVVTEKEFSQRFS